MNNLVGIRLSLVFGLGAWMACNLVAYFSRISHLDLVFSTNFVAGASSILRLHTMLCRGCTVIRLLQVHISQLVVPESLIGILKLDLRRLRTEARVLVLSHTHLSLTVHTVVDFASERRKHRLHWLLLRLIPVRVP